MVGQEGAARAPLLPPRAEHEVVHDQLASAVEEVGERRRALRSLEDIALADLPPRERTPLGAQPIAQPREFLLPCQMRFARLEPFVSRHDRVAWHHSSLSESSCLARIVGCVSPAPVIPRRFCVATAASRPRRSRRRRSAPRLRCMEDTWAPPSPHKSTGRGPDRQCVTLLNGLAPPCRPRTPPGGRDAASAERPWGGPSRRRAGPESRKPRTGRRLNPG